MVILMVMMAYRQNPRSPLAKIHHLRPLLRCQLTQILNPNLMKNPFTLIFHCELNLIEMVITILLLIIIILLTRTLRDGIGDGANTVCSKANL
jgi:hypothetical protein